MPAAALHAKLEDTACGWDDAPVLRAGTRTLRAGHTQPHAPPPTARRSPPLHLVLSPQFHDPETEVLWEGAPIENPFDDNRKKTLVDYRDGLYERVKHANEVKQQQRRPVHSRR